jgi:hypothetical protein
LLESDLELAALRPGSLGALAVEGDALVDQLQLVLEQRDLVIQSPASLCIAETRTRPNSVPLHQMHQLNRVSIDAGGAKKEGDDRTL